MTSSDMAQEVTPERARRQLVEELTARGWITQPPVAVAFAAVPRHLFALAWPGQTSPSMPVGGRDGER